jgi:16S rRNA (guanine(966)-N(2))-methyltransferase RsmD
MRIIAGSAKGARLSSPADLPIRPTLDRVREALFSILMPHLENAHFLDLFAGTGANGIEALSRGAAQATFVDADLRALNLVRENLLHAKLERGAECLRLSLPKDLERLRGPYDIVFADPPYEFAAYPALLEGLDAHRLLAPDGVIVIEHGRLSMPPETAGGLNCYRRAHYGDAHLSFYA